MPSVALTTWQGDRQVRLARVEAACLALMPPGHAFPAMGIAAPSPAVSPLAEESLQGFVMLLSGHFQGFCRDLFTECTQACTAVVPPGLATTAQAQFAAELKLNSMNPTVETIRKDFERFGFLLDLPGADPANPARITQLGHLNYWRNAIAHQKATPSPRSMPTTPNLSNAQSWRMACDGLAESLVDIMGRELQRILGVPPW